MKSDIPGREKSKYHFKYFPIAKPMAHTKGTKQFQAPSIFILLPWYKTLLKRETHIYQRNRCLPGSYTSCKLYIHLHPRAETWFHPTTECLPAIQS